MLPPLPLAMYLRLASSLAFVLAVMIAAGANRSLLMVPILAGASTLAHWLASKIAGSPIGQLPGITAQRVMQYRQNMARAGFIAGLFGYGFIYVLVVFLNALAGGASLSRSLGGPDLQLIAGPFLFALAIGVARRFLPQPVSVVSRSSADFHDFEDGHDGVVIDGEFVREDPSDGKPGQR